MSRIRIRVCLPPLMSCRSYVYVSSVKSTTCLLSLTDSHVIDAWVHMPPERFCPYSLLSGTTIRTTNRTSFLVFLWYSTKPYAPIASSRALWCLPPQIRVTLFLDAQLVRHLPQSGVDLYRALTSNVLRVIGRLCTTADSRTRKNCVRTGCLDCESSRKEQSPALVYAIEGTRT